MKNCKNCINLRYEKGIYKCRVLNTNSTKNINLGTQLKNCTFKEKEKKKNEELQS